MKSFMKKLTSFALFILSFGGDICLRSVNDGICDFGGQGRDRYGN